MSFSTPRKKIKIFKIIGQSFKVLPKTIGMTILVMLGLIFLISLLQYLLLDLTGFTWNYIDLGNQYKPIYDLITANPDYGLSPEQLQVQKLYSTYSLINSSVRFTFPFLIFIGVFLFLGARIYTIISEFYNFNDITPANSWKESFKAPFFDKNSIFTSLFWLIAGSIFVAIGFQLYILPGVFIIIYVIFALYALLIDKKVGKHAFKGARFYSRGYIVELLFFILIGFLVPLFLGEWLSGIFLSIVGFTNENFLVWINPATFNGANVFLYDFMNTFNQLILTFWFPTLFTVAFMHIRRVKLEEIQEHEELFSKNPNKVIDVSIEPKTYQINSPDPSSDFSTASDTSVTMNSPSNSDSSKINVQIVKINISDKHYNCPKCGKNLPISTRKCPNCGTLIKIRYFN